jgi:hypothetical protein
MLAEFQEGKSAKLAVIRIQKDLYSKVTGTRLDSIQSNLLFEL